MLVPTKNTTNTFEAYGKFSGANAWRKKEKAGQSINTVVQWTIERRLYESREATGKVV
jgi:hypothetical protein